MPLHSRDASRRGARCWRRRSAKVFARAGCEVLPPGSPVSARSVGWRDAARRPGSTRLPGMARRPRPLSGFRPPCARSSRGRLVAQPSAAAFAGIFDFGTILRHSAPLTFPLQWDERGASSMVCGPGTGAARPVRRGARPAGRRPRLRRVGPAVRCGRRAPPTADPAIECTHVGCGRSSSG
jgi:hypothetical protein